MQCLLGFVVILACGSSAGAYSCIGWSVLLFFCTDYANWHIVVKLTLDRNLCIQMRILWY